MIGDLYGKDLLRLAASAVGAGRLNPADATATVDNPLCGDRVTIDLRAASGRIGDLGHHVRGCVLCQASAAVVGGHAKGESAASLEKVRGAVAAMLNKEGPAPVGAWADLAAFLPVADHKSRHQCVLLPFSAAIEAAAKLPQTRG